MAQENASPKTGTKGEMAAARSVALASRRLGFALHEALRERSGNLVYSPLSVFTLLAILLQGARGHTEAELKRALHWPGESQALASAVHAFAETLRADSSVESFMLSSANALWLQLGLLLRPEFEEALRTSFGATYTPADFERSREEVGQQINGWVREQTRGLIDSLVTPEELDSTTSLVLANAVFFQARWRDPFPVASTRPGPFRLLDGSTVEVPMMHHLHGRFGYARGPRCQLVELPYRGKHVSLWLLLPDKGCFSRCERGLGERQVEEALRTGGERYLDLTMPRISFGQRTPLGAVAERLGFGSLLSYADLTGMTPALGVLSGVLMHEATLTVDETGTEAAAVTVFRDVIGDQHEVEVDRPFLFFIRHARTGAVLFMGRVVDPRG